MLSNVVARAYVLHAQIGNIKPHLLSISLDEMLTESKFQSSQLSSRYLTIDLEQLVKAAVNAVCARGEHDCNTPSATIVIRPPRCLAVACQVPRLRDIKDGNKASNTMMDNGTLKITRLPCPAAGPIYYIDLHIMQRQPKVARARSKVLTVAEIGQF